ncbi:3-dehydroquinate synthase [Fundidesulfovibrio magnetotacticus]|uniref:3-dehydroquinate synthase n=1 Tax=Fundidesulfovibrio magnetotacticus TaxID=2730080 RepID=A0A6V8LSI9_9BACT|nr:3-dehydroquinate synthase [Fundidesulfovibrio magnetotacticus]GFK93278.1 3-dehydroquinate synthase [Fundidesulfovibrio magnetotacticus]
MSKTIRQALAVPYEFPVVFTRDAFDPENPALADILALAPGGPHRLAAVFDQGLLRAFPDLPERLEAYLRARPGALNVAPPLALPGGEAAKNDLSVFHATLEHIFAARLCRQSFLLVAGGGALLDAAGFAAATAHRGVRLIRMPSTALAQNDAGVGVKNAVNFFGRKNFLGTFAPPFAVLSDFAFLDGLPARERRAGLAEAVKIALIKDRAFFDRLHVQRDALGRFEPDPYEHSIERCAELHLEHIATSGDPFEFGSSRPLDFGHWSAHALEEASGGSLGHGEAVAVGVALDSVYSRLAGLLPEADLERILEVLPALGFTPWHAGLDSLDMEAALEAFREHLGGRLFLSLLTGIGSRVEVNAVDFALMRRASDQLRERFA